MYPKIKKFIDELSLDSISEERREILIPLSQYIQSKIAEKNPVNLNFICTHNSRRSHLGQIWAKTMADYFNLENIYTYSGGTESTAIFPKVVETLENIGFKPIKLSDNENSVYGIKYGETALPLICFSKKFEDDFNPKKNFAAVMTCSQADEDCPFVFGAEKRFPITYSDPKLFDNSSKQNEMYEERSKQIATEMKYVFSLIQK